MKKIFAFILTLLLIFSCFLTANAAPKSTNYISGLQWDYNLACKTNNKNGLYVEATNITQTYSSPVINIASGIINAFVDNTLPSSITFKIGGKAKVNFNDNNSNSLSARLIIRAKTNMRDADAWLKRYKEELNGNTPFFFVEGPNAYQVIKDNLSIKTDWTDFSTTVTITSRNAFCSETPNWDLCFDHIEIEKNPQTLFFKDMFLEVVSVKNNQIPKPTQKPATISTPEPTPFVPPMVTPSQTLPPFKTPLNEATTSTLKPTQDPYEDTLMREEFLNQEAFKDAKDIVLLGVIGTVSVIIVSGIVSIIFKLIRKRNE